MTDEQPDGNENIYRCIYKKSTSIYSTVAKDIFPNLVVVGVIIICAAAGAVILWAIGSIYGPPVLTALVEWLSTLQIPDAFLGVTLIIEVILLVLLSPVIYSVWRCKEQELLKKEAKAEYDLGD